MIQKINNTDGVFNKDRHETSPGQTIKVLMSKALGRLA